MRIDKSYHACNVLLYFLLLSNSNITCTVVGNPFFDKISEYHLSAVFILRVRTSKSYERN